MAKVLIVIARLNVGGTAQYVGQAVKSLVENGYEVLVATGFVQGAEVEDSVVKELPIERIRSLGRKVSPVKDFSARRELRKLIASYKPDLIYSHTFKAGALVRSLKLEVPVIHAFHGHLMDEPELKGLKVRVVMTIERALAQRAKVLVTVGKRVAKELLEAKVGKESQYLSIAPGVLPLELSDREVARRNLGLEDQKRPVIAWLARVVAVKGPHRLVELARKIPEARFIMAGGGDLLEEIRDLAPENLTILGWQDAKDVWAVADLAVSTSENEGMPVALIEAQLAGIPIVALDVGSVAEVIQDGKSGFVFEEFGDSYVEAVRKLALDATLRKEMGQSAREIAKERFGVERFTQEHLRLIDSVR